MEALGEQDQVVVYRHSETRVRLVTVALLTAVGVVGHSNDAHGLLGDVHTQQLHVAAHIFVGPLHCPPYPVGPEDVLPIHSQPERVDWL